MALSAVLCVRALKQLEFEIMLLFHFLLSTFTFYWIYLFHFPLKYKFSGYLELILSPVPPVMGLFVSPSKFTLETSGYWNLEI